jgi:small nuclear ribonucleoprotein (snRNP)-like protein
VSVSLFGHELILLVLILWEVDESRSSQKHSMSAIDNLKELLGKAVRVVLADGRVIEGSLHCMDKDLNFILGEACEYHGVEDGKPQSHAICVWLQSETNISLCNLSSYSLRV